MWQYRAFRDQNPELHRKYNAQKQADARAEAAAKQRHAIHAAAEAAKRQLIYEQCKLEEEETSPPVLTLAEQVLHQRAQAVVVADTVDYVFEGWLKKQIDLMAKHSARQEIEGRLKGDSEKRAVVERLSNKLHDNQIACELTEGDGELIACE